MEQPAARVTFVQAGIRVERLEAFEQLRSGFERIFAGKQAASFLRLLQRKGVPIRDFDRVLNERLMEQSDAPMANGGQSAKRLYESLAVSDQAQIREFYLTALENVDDSLRGQYRKVYRYY